MNSDGYIQKVVQMGQDKGIEIKTYDVLARVMKDNRLDLTSLMTIDDQKFELMRRNAYLEIAHELTGVENAIIKTHATVEWNTIGHGFIRDSEVIRKISIDKIVTLIDSEWLIEKRFKDPQTENDRVFGKQLDKYQNRFEKILDWINNEILQVENWTYLINNMDKINISEYVLPTGQPTESLYKIVTIPDVPIFYASYSMSHAPQKVRKIVDNGIIQLREYGVVLDPQAIEIELNAPPGLDKDATYANTVHRDLHHTVHKLKQSSKNAIVAFHPYDTDPIFSSGMCEELNAAYNCGVRRYVVMPNSKSPFTVLKYASENCLFDNNEQLFATLEKDGYRKLVF
ncbi:hypothetical protein COV93_01990 [Candidatus Woesearchaeota archaeon CG11_big_fil_rev_8_21_14_0_20_43_8]|nr:MAG: hypothetical protein COV93_01990 [Candidatus Woesearchaeota archaeon CG11_big_fil_rev_8_21_14_0_20_43_8]PIO06897.1 MAG: hypothetical protein COT47_02365 [Candidatus Woesearchaeota archaeon CG08_land_8_20_14_0_20_43_7]